MREQIRAWDEREEGVETPAFVIAEEMVLKIDEEPTFVDRIELILQLRELQEPDLYAV